MQTGKLFDSLEVRDTSAHNSSVVRLATHEGTLFVIINRTNQSASVQFQGRVTPEAVKTLTLTAGVATETFKLTFNSHESSTAVTLPVGGFANVTAAQIKACLITISDWAAQSANISVVKSTNDFVITFSGTLGTTDLGLITVTSKTGAANGSVSEVSPWFNIGSAVTVAATAQNVQTLTDPWPQVRAAVTYSVAPTIGSVSLWWVAHGRAL